MWKIHLFSSGNQMQKLDTLTKPRDLVFTFYFVEWSTHQIVMRTPSAGNEALQRTARRIEGVLQLLCGETSRCAKRKVNGQPIGWESEHEGE